MLLSPQNLLFTTDDPESPVKVVDFGFARFKPSEEAGMRTPCFTLNYAAPEVLSQAVCMNDVDGYDESCDLWSLGVILYTMLSGRAPFQGDNRDLSPSSSSSQMVMKRIQEGDFSLNSSQWKDVSRNCKDVIVGLLNVDPKKRLSLNQLLEHPWIQEQILKGTLLISLTQLDFLSDIKFPSGNSSLPTPVPIPSITPTPGTSVQADRIPPPLSFCLRRDKSHCSQSSSSGCPSSSDSGRGTSGLPPLNTSLSSSLSGEYSHHTSMSSSSTPNRGLKLSSDSAFTFDRDPFLSSLPSHELMDDLDLQHDLSLQMMRKTSCPLSQCSTCYKRNRTDSMTSVTKSLAIEPSSAIPVTSPSPLTPQYVTPSPAASLSIQNTSPPSSALPLRGKSSRSLPQKKRQRVETIVID